MSDNNGNTTPRGTIAKQAETLLEDDADDLELVCGLNLRSLSSYDDQYAEWHSSYSLEAMARAHLLRLLMDYSITELHQRLDENPDDAYELGFESVPARTTIGRAWRDRFDEKLIRSLEYNSKKILEHAHSNGNPLGMRSLEPDEKGNVSERTKDRYIDEKAEEIVEEMKRLVFPAFTFDRAKNAQYEKDTFLELQCYLGFTDSAAEEGTDLFASETIRSEGAPDGDTHLYNVRRWDHERVLRMIEESINRMVHQAKHHLQFNRPAEVAIDMTYVAYYGDRDELEWVMGAPENKSYDWCYKFATLGVVGDNVKFTLAMVPVRPGYLVGEIVRELIWKARTHVSMSMVYADSEFCSVDTIRALEEAGLGYVIPSPKNVRVKREIERMTRGVKVLKGYAMYGRVSGGPSNARESTNMILLPSSRNESKTVAFITNKDVDDEIRLDREEAKGWVNRYSRRWGIENSYRTIKSFLATTTSRNFVVRLFYFGFAVLLYNMWLLVDLLVQISLDVEHRYKPRVKAKKFLNLARKHLGMPG